MSNGKSILITGCSTGIGHACAHGMKERGWQVLATARKPSDVKRLKSEGLEALQLDYTKPQSIKACAEKALEATDGKLFALFNNGGYGQPGAVEDVPAEALRIQLETNVIGWHDLTRQLIPAMRRNSAGRIVQCSSVLGLVTLKWRGAYNASKFAIQGLSETMRLELAGSGIGVSIIEPGPIRSNFGSNAIAQFEKWVDQESSVHREIYRKRKKKQDRPDSASRFRLEPEAVLEKLVHAVESDSPRAHYYVTVPTHAMAMARRILPQGLLDKVLQKASG